MYLKSIISSTYIYIVSSFYCFWLEMYYLFICLFFPQELQVVDSALCVPFLFFNVFIFIFNFLIYIAYINFFSFFLAIFYFKPMISQF